MFVGQFYYHSTSLVFLEVRVYTSRSDIFRSMKLISLEDKNSEQWLQFSNLSMYLVFPLDA